MIRSVLAAYIPLPKEGPFDECTPDWTVVLTAVGLLLTLISMCALIHKTLKKNWRRRK